MRLLFLLLLCCASARGEPIFTEVVTDPQADHSENAGGNGVLYDTTPGTGTVSSVDEFVELYNAGPTAIDLTGYRIDFLDSTPSSYVFGTTTAGTLLFSPGSILTVLRPGGFALLGNPPGALNNRIELRLTDPWGAVVDTWNIEDGNATGRLNEAVTRVWDGKAFGKAILSAAITPLGAGSPAAPGQPPATPEPGTLLLVGLAFSAAALASGRIARWRARRRSSGSPVPHPAPRPGPEAGHGYRLRHAGRGESS